jgi:hypothetical protein
VIFLKEVPLGRRSGIEQVLEKEQSAAAAEDAVSVGAQRD